MQDTIWHFLTRKLRPQAGTPWAALGDPLGLQQGLPEIHAHLQEQWPRAVDWTCVAQVRDDVLPWDYEARALWVTWLLLRRLAVEINTQTSTKTTQPQWRGVDIGLGLLNLLWDVTIPGNTDGAQGLNAAASAGLKRCIAMGTHATMALVLQKLCLRWDDIKPGHFPELHNSVDHAQRTKGPRNSGAEPPKKRRAWPLRSGRAPTLADQWLDWIQAPFPGADPQTENPTNVHLALCEDEDASHACDAPNQPFAALLSVFRSHKAGEAQGFVKGTLGAWLADSQKCRPERATSFQNVAWQYGHPKTGGREAERLLPPLLLYMLAWAASEHVLHELAQNTPWDRLLSCSPPRSTAPKHQGPAVNTPTPWTLQTRARELGRAFDEHQRKKAAQRNAQQQTPSTRKMPSTALFYVPQPVGNQRPVVAAELPLDASWLSAMPTGATAAEDTASDGPAPEAQTPGCLVVWLPEEPPKGLTCWDEMRALLAQCPAFGRMTIETESGVALVSQGVLTTDWLLLPDEPDPHALRELHTPLPLWLHSEADIVKTLAAGQVDTQGEHFGMEVTLAWITGAACQRPQLTGEVFVEAVITVPDDWAELRSQPLLRR